MKPLQVIIKDTQKIALWVDTVVKKSYDRTNSYVAVIVHENGDISSIYKLYEIKVCADQTNLEYT